MDGFGCCNQSYESYNGCHDAYKQDPCSISLQTYRPPPGYTPPYRPATTCNVGCNFNSTLNSSPQKDDCQKIPPIRCRDFCPQQYKPCTLINSGDVSVSDR